MWVIGPFVTSEGEGLNNQHQNMKLREAKATTVATTTENAHELLDSECLLRAFRIMKSDLKTRPRL